MLGIKIGVNLEVKLGVGSKTGIKNTVSTLLKCMDGSVLAFLKCTDGSALVFLKCMVGSVLAHLRFPMQSAPTRLPQWGNSEVPELLSKKSTKILYLKLNAKYCHAQLSVFCDFCLAVQWLFCWNYIRTNLCWISVR
jgi:hypothetical protein